jgi:dihydrofolate reductase
MGRVIVMNGLTLDGVMQSPGRSDDDRRGGFEYGGWAVPYSDEEAVAKTAEQLRDRTGGRHEWLFGRRTYETVLAFWNTEGGPFKDPLNNIQKYVASSHPDTALEWPNSTLLHTNVPAAVADLKRTSDTNLVIMGSGVLIASLMASELIDEYLISIAPVVLGTGRRMFPEGVNCSLRLTDSTATDKGAIIATYETIPESHA